MSKLQQQWRPRKAKQMLHSITGVFFVFVFLGVTLGTYGWAFNTSNIFSDQPYEYENGGRIMLWVIMAIPALILLLIVIGTIAGVVGWFRTMYFQYDDKIEDVSPLGILGVDSDEIFYSAIRSVTSSQTTFGSLFGYRTIHLHREGKETTYDIVAAPEELKLLEFFKNIAAQNDQSRNG